jgi:toxin ParE1/3/4
VSRYLLTPASRRDLSDIWDYTVERWGSRRAEKYIRDVQEAIELLAETPQVGRGRAEVRDGYSSYSCGRHVVFYKIFSSHIEVIRILHQRMDFGSHL